MGSEDLRFYEALDNYINQKSNDWKEYTHQGIKGRAKRIKDIFADLKLKEITTEELQDYVDEWQKQFSTNTIKSYIVLIMSVLKKNGFRIGSPKIKNYTPKKIFYSNEEIEKISQYFMKSSKIKHNHLAIPIAMYTGLRIGEILALQWMDVDLNRKLISVSKNAEHIYGKGSILQTPKTESSIREVAIPNQLYDILIKFAPQKDEDWDNFVTSNSKKPQGNRTASKCAERLFVKIFVEFKGFHAFRHSYATNMLESGVNTKVVSDLLGHSNISTTLNIYSHTSNDLKKECVDKVFEDKKYEREKEKKELYQQILEMQKTMNELLIKVSSL